MTVTLGSLTLSHVAEVNPVYAQRLPGTAIPGMRGDSRQDTGAESSGIELVGTLTTDWYEGLHQLRRAKSAGVSLKLLSDPVSTVVWLKSVEPTLMWPTMIQYRLGLIESMFKQADPCDAVTEWSVDSGGGALTAITSAPSPREGSACLKLSGIIAAAT